MKIRHVGTKMLLVLIISVVLAGGISAFVTYYGVRTIVDDAIDKNTTTSLQILVSQVQSAYNDISEKSVKMADTYGLINALETGNESRYDAELISACQSNASSASFVSLFDRNGNEVARFEDGGYSHERMNGFGRQEVIRSALVGKKVCSYTEGFGSKFVICAAAPITGSSGDIVGGIALVYKLDNYALVDTIKELSGSEFTIFADNERVNTTLIDENGAREIGSEMSAEVEKAVLGEHKEFSSTVELFGKSYHAKYMPIVQDGEAIGAYFSGVNIDDILTKERGIIIFSFLVVLLICIIASVISYIIVNVVVVRPIKKVGQIVRNIAEGKLRGRLIEVKGYDEISELERNTNTTAENLSKYISDIINKVDALAAKDITISFDQNYVGDYVKIEDSLKKITDMMNRTFQLILESCDQVSVGADQIAIGAQNLAQGATAQAEAVLELSDSVRKLNSGVKENMIGVDRVTDGINTTMLRIKEGTEKMDQLLESMEQITRSTNEISSVIRVIDDISFQTNILALNAAVEAESAGEAGKGFAVVASQVQKLSEKTAAAVKETNELILKSIEDVQNGSVMLKETALAIDVVHHDAENINVLMRRINETFKIEMKDIDDITRESETITQVIQNNSATSEESAAASEELSGQAALLRDKLREFNLREDKEEEINYGSEYDKVEEEPENKIKIDY